MGVREKDAEERSIPAPEPRDIRQSRLPRICERQWQADVKDYPPPVSLQLDAATAHLVRSPMDSSAHARTVLSFPCWR